MKAASSSGWHCSLSPLRLLLLITSLCLTLLPVNYTTGHSDKLSFKARKAALFYDIKWIVKCFKILNSLLN